MTAHAFEIARLDIVLLNAPVEMPRLNAFGAQASRPAVLIRLEDQDGAYGFGEVFANWPPGGAEHRGRLIDKVFRPLVEGQAFASPPELFERLTAATRLLAIQCGEPGPFAQCISGLDAAAWDVVARRRGQPLWQVLSGRERPHPLPAYASGLSGAQIDTLAPAALAQGYRGFKLKVGFGREADGAAFERLRGVVGADAALMADANMAWPLERAMEMVEVLAPFRLVWLEEPIAADQPDEAWRALAKAAPMPLAAGENMRGAAHFEAADYLRFVQPDVAKWGGVSEVYEVAMAAVQRGQVYCPHFLSSAIGLHTSAHVLAAVGGGGWLEIDANPNPLRTALAGDAPKVVDGQFVLPAGAGIGVEPDLERASEWRVHPV